MPTSNAYWPDGGRSFEFDYSPYFIDGWGNSPPSRRKSSYEESLCDTNRKCPFCGSRQNVDRDGANCLHCGGDVLHPYVR